MPLDSKLKNDCEIEDTKTSTTSNENNFDEDICDEKVEKTDIEPLHTNDQEVFSTSLIEEQLKLLNQNIAELSTKVSESKKIDLSSLIEKVNLTNSNMEKVLKQIANQGENSTDNSLIDKIDELENAIKSITTKQDRNDRQLAQTLRENANFQIQVRQGMQQELDKFKKVQSGENLVPILKEISTIYVEYQSLLKSSELQGKPKKLVSSLFEQLEDLLDEYNAEIIVSKVGSVRKARQAKIIEKILTSDESKHNTIAKSRNPGVILDRNVLYPEYVDVFVYDPTFVEQEETECAHEEINQESSKEEISTAELVNTVETEESNPIEVDTEVTTEETDSSDKENIEE